MKDEEGDEKVLRYEEVNNPSTFKRVLRHLQLEKKVGVSPEVYFSDGDNEFKVEFGSKNLEFLIASFEKLEDRILKEWAKYEEKLAKARAKGKEPDAEPPVDNARYVITARLKGDVIEEITFDKRLTSELMGRQAVILRYVARMGEGED